MDETQETHETQARIDVLSAAIRACLRALPDSVARDAAEQLRIEAQSLDALGENESADSAAAGELFGLLAALQRPQTLATRGTVATEAAHRAC
jgi:hypothetical protein